MYTLRLFHQTDPFHQIESRRLADGELTIGRDTGADWTIEDTEREISRLHCTLSLRDGRLSVSDTSANGVFVGPTRARVEPGKPARVGMGETVRLGRFLIVADRGDSGDGAFDAPFHQPVLSFSEGGAESLAVPSDWATPDAPFRASKAAGDGALLDAFCEGARLDVSAFAGEDPAEVMRRLGAVYRQMVLGLGDLMNERTSVKGEFRLERTTVRAEGNNPFRWAPAHRVAVDLLKARDDGFLSGPAAVRVSFEDMKKHLLCMLSGLKAAVSSTLDSLSPTVVEEQMSGRSFLSRGGAAWNEYSRLYAEFKRQAGDDPDSPVNREFRSAYERRLQELDAVSTRS
jgi:predicted component of type VI protein secretion system